MYEWKFWARPSQLPPAGDWTFWLLLSGRGFGKTRTGAEWAVQKAFDNPNTHGALIAPTAADARKVMLSADNQSAEDASGIMAIAPPWFRPRYESSNRQLIWPNGTVCTLYSAEEPDRLRGPQHHWGWGDEVAAWKPNKEGKIEAWDQFLFGLRLGKSPQACITTTPRPIPLIKQLLLDPNTVVTRGSTYDNRGNLAPKFFETIITQYEGTRLGRQELMGDVLTDVEGALWTQALIDKFRVDGCPQLIRVGIGIDPAVSNSPTADETGIVIAGLGIDGHGYVMDDASCRTTPLGWATICANKFNEWRADYMVAEVNNGGDLVTSNLAAVCPRAPYRAVHASRGKFTRADPISALYEQGRIHHVRALPPNTPPGVGRNHLEKLEDQMCSWAPMTGAKSPDRMDALVWILTDLFLGVGDPGILVYENRVEISRY